MSMYFDLTVNGKTLMTDAQGATCDALYEFIEATIETPMYATYNLSAKSVAKFLAERHKAIVNEDGEADFRETDSLCYETHIHLTDVKSVEKFNNAEILLGEKIDNESILIVDIN